MAIFFTAIGSGLALFARRTAWNAERSQASHSLKVEINPFPWSNLTLAYDGKQFEAYKARNRGADSKLRGSNNWPGQPPRI
jgi:hypothetical protein